MVKGVIAGFENASLDRSVVAVVFTGVGPYAFCTGGNTKEYSEFYSKRNDEYGQYISNSRTGIFYRKFNKLQTDLSHKFIERNQ